MAKRNWITRTMTRKEITIGHEGKIIMTLPEGNEATALAALYGSGAYKEGSLSAKVVEIEETRRISVDEFIKHSEIVEPKKEEDVNNG